MNDHVSCLSCLWAHESEIWETGLFFRSRNNLDVSELVRVKCLLKSQGGGSKELQRVTGCGLSSGCNRKEASATSHDLWLLR